MAQSEKFVRNQLNKANDLFYVFLISANFQSWFGIILKRDKALSRERAYKEKANVAFSFRNDDFGGFCNHCRWYDWLRG